MFERGPDLTRSNREPVCVSAPRNEAKCRPYFFGMTSNAMLMRVWSELNGIVL